MRNEQQEARERLRTEASNNTLVILLNAKTEIGRKDWLNRTVNTEVIEALDVAISKVYEYEFN